MWVPTWKKSIIQIQNRLRAASELRIAIVGIGFEFGGDDAAGAMVMERLTREHQPVDPGSVLLINAGVAPENYTGVIRRFQPEVVILVDAAQMDEAPGSIQFLDWRETSGVSAVTHGLPPYMLAQYLESEVGCEVYLIGIQPGTNQFNERMSEEVEAAVQEVSQILANLVIIPGRCP